MGGHKAGNQPANILVLCSLANGLIESDAKEAETARRFGWKIGRYADPAAAPYYDATTGVWWQPDNFFGRKRAIWQ